MDKDLLGNLINLWIDQKKSSKKFVDIQELLEASSALKMRNCYAEEFDSMNTNI